MRDGLQEEGRAEGEREGFATCPLTSKDDDIFINVQRGREGGREAEDAGGGRVKERDGARAPPMWRELPGAVRKDPRAEGCESVSRHERIEGQTDGPARAVEQGPLLRYPDGPTLPTKGCDSPRASVPSRAGKGCGLELRYPHGPEGSASAMKRG
jgi:hypothetical protein